MASHLVSQHQIGNLSSPVNGDAGDATVVLGNDNTIIDGYNPHDSDGTIHVQSSSAAVFGAVAAGTEGRKWMTQDTGAVYLYLDTGAAWVEVNYLRQAANGTVTVTSTTGPQATIAYDGSNKLEISVSSAGAVTLNATGASAGFSFSDPVILASTLRLNTDTVRTALSGATDVLTLAGGFNSLVVTPATTFSAGISATTGTFSDNVSVVTTKKVALNAGLTSYIQETGGNIVIKMNGGTSLTVGPTDVTAANNLTSTAATYAGSGTSPFGAGWMFGAADTVSPTSPDRTIAINVNGTTYYLHAKTTND